MAKKYINWKTKGMNRDMSVSAFNPEFAFENVNLRLATNEGNTMMSWVNERGTKELRLSIEKDAFYDKIDSETTIEGSTIGTAIINHKLVVFTTGTYDNIYVFKKSNETEYDYKGIALYSGKLGFSIDRPIETLVSYESENIQKVYWTDNKNQPRVINVAIQGYSDLTRYNDYSFDFVPELSLNEEVKVTKLFGSGEFPSGVIQYAFTYYNKYGQESNIFYTTPLQYISYIDRGGAPDAKIANSFKIEISNVDYNFDYLRIYSILRTSLNSTPVVKRVQDLKIGNNSSLFFTDNGLQGETIDPTELLYKGGEEIKAKTLEQKDETLFLGNIDVTRPTLSDVKGILQKANGVTKDNPIANDRITAEAVSRSYRIISRDSFPYINTLSNYESGIYDGAACFKSREYYRLGVQFQYKNGKWSEPCWVGDKRCEAVPSSDEYIGILKVPEFKYSLDKLPAYTIESIFAKLYKQGYRKIRPMFALPGNQDRTILCQGIGAPTMYRPVDRKNSLYASASWLFRTKDRSDEDKDPIDRNIPNKDYPEGTYTGGGYVSYSDWVYSQFKTDYVLKQGGAMDVVSPYLSSTEVMGNYDEDNTYHIDRQLFTVNSPDIEFNSEVSHVDFNGYTICSVGYTTFEKTFGDIDIQVSTPAIGSDAGGFIHRSIVAPGSAALISGLFFNDYLVDDLDDTPKYGAYHTESPAIDYPIFMWHKNGSLNNDVSRDNRSANLLKKRISNYRLGGQTTYAAIGTAPIMDTKDIQLFNTDQLAVIKVNGHTYEGNMDTLITPSEPSPFYFVGDPWREANDKTKATDYKSRSYYKLKLKNPSDTNSRSGVWVLEQRDGNWDWREPTGDRQNIGDKVKGLDQWREGISIKYKSSPHLVAQVGDTFGVFNYVNYQELKKAQAPVVEVYKEYNDIKNTIFGGTSDEALQAATWIPCGPPVSFNSDTESVDLHFKWGDSYFQRYEALKTYPFTKEDKNQVVEIASFMVETRVNIDGRYDRNRGQISNLNMTPQNFNLINPVYSQIDNFFSYKMLSEDDYKNTSYPNTVTWTKTKQNGADVDLWTNITMANTLEMDGDKGTVNKLIRFNNQLLSFQDSGISQILYNENTQISTTEGVPIEIANSEKVQGKRYLSDTVGCSNKWSIAQTSSGIYFMDSNDKSIYFFNGQLNNLSTAGGFNSWAKQNIPSADTLWTPKDGFDNFVTYYDKLNQDVLFINKDTALAYSEKFNCFTSFYDYGNVPYFENFDDVGIWIKGSKLWQHQAGEYCNFFGKNKPYSMTLIANQEPQMDKIFTNLQFRACVDGEGTYDSSKDKFVPSLPFDSLETWDEYQHGILTLGNRNANDRFTHGKDNGILARKFRMWSCDIPRDNAKVDATTEAPMGIKRFKARPLDRIRTPWAYIKLSKNAANTGFLSKVEVHDIMATYFG